MVFDEINIFDTPQRRYDVLRKEFFRKYLNPKAWDHDFDTKEMVKAYHDLLEFLEKTESFRVLTRSLYAAIPTDNLHLVLGDLPLPQKRREELMEYVIAGNPSEEDQLSKIKEFFKIKVKSGLNGIDKRSRIDVMRCRIAHRGVVHENIEKSVEEDKKKSNEVKRNKRRKEESEILEVRQKVYSKLNKGLNAFSILKMFKRKVENFLENYRADLSYHEEKYWREKVIITEKAVVRNENELKAANHSIEDESLAPSVKEIFDAVKAQELMIENLPEPPQYDDIEEKLAKLKKFTKRLNVAEKPIDEPKVTNVKADDINVLTVDRNDVKRDDLSLVGNKKDEDFFDMDELLGKNLFWSNDMNTKEYEDEVTEHDEEDSENEIFDNKAEENVVEECTKSKIKRRCENEAETGLSVFDEIYRAEVMEFNNWYNNKLKEGKHSKVNNKNSKIFYDKIAPGYSSIFEKNVHDDIMYMQVPSGTGKENEVVKRADVTAILALLQAVLAILIVGGKTLHEQSLLNA